MFTISFGRSQINYLTQETKKRTAKFPQKKQKRGICKVEIN